MTLITQPGFYDLTAAEYHADPCETPSLSSSIAKILISQSPLHAFTKHPRFNKQVEAFSTSELEFGDVVHQLALGKGHGFAIWAGKSWAGKEAGAFWDAALAANKTPIKQADYDRAQAVVASLRKQLEAFGLNYVLDPLTGTTEQVCVWKSGPTWMRAMFDRWIPNAREIWDIKTISRSAHPKAVASQIINMGYDLQAEFYKMGPNHLFRETPGYRVDFGFIFVETSYPYACFPCRLNGEWKTIGISKASRAIAAWADCMESHKWPGYISDRVPNLEPPSWALSQEIGAETIRPD